MSEESREEGQREPNIKLYIVVACIAALVLVAVMQVNITNILLSALIIFFQEIQIQLQAFKKPTRVLFSPKFKNTKISILSWSKVSA